MTTGVGHFNPKLSNWYKHNETLYEGAKKEALAWHHGLHKISSKPTLIRAKRSSSINLIFTSNQNLELGFHPSLYSNYYYQIVYAKFLLKIHYPLPYEWKRAPPLGGCSSSLKCNWKFFLGKCP